jgi:hypothetical protein
MIIDNFQFYPLIIIYFHFHFHFFHKILDGTVPGLPCIGEDHAP